MLRNKKRDMYDSHAHIMRSIRLDMVSGRMQANKANKKILRMKQSKKSKQIETTYQVCVSDNC